MNHFRFLFLMLCVGSTLAPATISAQAEPSCVLPPEVSASAGIAVGASGWLGDGYSRVIREAAYSQNVDDDSRGSLSLGWGSVGREASGNRQAVSATLLEAGATYQRPVYGELLEELGVKLCARAGARMSYARGENLDNATAGILAGLHISQSIPLGPVTLTPFGVVALEPHFHAMNYRKLEYVSSSGYVETYEKFRERDADLWIRLGGAATWGPLTVFLQGSTGEPTAGGRREVRAGLSAQF